MRASFTRLQLQSRPESRLAIPYAENNIKVYTFFGPKQFERVPVYGQRNFLRLKSILPHRWQVYELAAQLVAPLANSLPSLKRDFAFMLISYRRGHIRRNFTLRVPSVVGIKIRPPVLVRQVDRHLRKANHTTNSCCTCRSK